MIQESKKFVAAFDIPSDGSEFIGGNEKKNIFHRRDVKNHVERNVFIGGMVIKH